MGIVRKRCVFYVGGFDPAGARRYHELYREQGLLQERNGGLALQVGARRKLPSGDSCWSVQAFDAGGQVATDYQFLQWDSIVRRHWTRKVLPLQVEVLRASLAALRDGALSAMWQAHRTSAAVVALPLLVILGSALGAPAAALVAGWAAHRAGGSGGASVAAGSAVAACLLWYVQRQRRAYSADWIGRSLAFTRRQAAGRVPELEQLLDRHAERVALQLLAGVDDEVLVVGHSSGSFLAISVLARALRLLGAAPSSSTTLSLLTLGQCIPVLGAMRQADAFRQELLEVARSDALVWIDFSAPPDACCFPLVDPLAACGVLRPPAAARGPLLLSPRFHEMFEAAEYAVRRRDKFRLHFQYLMAGRRPTAYDYFAITAGARTLRDRYAGPPQQGPA